MAESRIEVDTDDAGSCYSESLASDTTSLISSVLKHEWKHGRRYHSYHAGAYQFPNDEREQDRLDLIHHVFYRLTGNKLFMAPINPDGVRILDIGTGTGLWAIEMGDHYPAAECVIGTDLSPIQSKWVPPNVRFVVDDVEQDWVETQPYDYIHCKYMSGSIQNWQRLIQQCYEHLKPGGWLELQESDNTMYSEDGSLTPDNSMVRMMDGLMDAAGKIGRTMDPAPHMEGWAQHAGFTNINQQRFKLPIGSWPRDPGLKEIGTLMRVNFVEGVEAFTAALFQDVLGWPKDEVAFLNRAVQADAQRKDVHPLFNVLVTTAQKPA
jgi:SAM-dependent methyltransferase